MADGLFGLYWSERKDELVIDIRPFPLPPPPPSPVPNKSYVASVDVKQHERRKKERKKEEEEEANVVRTQELCESRGGRLGLSSRPYIVRMVSVDVKKHCSGDSLVVRASDS